MTSTPLTDRREGPFTLPELRRVGTAATIIAVCGTLIILAMTVLLGHYNSLAHCAPKAILDGAVIAMLIGRRGRWRCLALLGVVYGVVLLLQIGLFYLLPVMALAGGLAAFLGRTTNTFHRGSALLVAAAVYELLAGCGAPIRIYFGTGGKSEPFIWAMWLAELPLRVIGAWVGVWLTWRWQSRRSATPLEDKNAASLACGFANQSAIVANETESIRETASDFADVSATQRPLALRIDSRRRGVAHAAVRLAACMIACTVPMFVESTLGLAIIAAAYVVYSLWAGLRYRLLTAILGLLAGWFASGALSYAWHRDINRVMDLSRTLVLRFAPVALASSVLIRTTRPVDLVRVLRRMRLGATVLIPASAVIRSVPHSRRAARESIDAMRARGDWRGPISLITRPRQVARGLLGPHFKRWADALAEAPEREFSK